MTRHLVNKVESSSVWVWHRNSWSLKGKKPLDIGTYRNIAQHEDKSDRCFCVIFSLDAVMSHVFEKAKWSKGEFGCHCALQVTIKHSDAHHHEHAHHKHAPGFPYHDVPLDCLQTIFGYFQFAFLGFLLISCLRASSVHQLLFHAVKLALRFLEVFAQFLVVFVAIYHVPH